MASSGPDDSLNRLPFNDRRNDDDDDDSDEEEGEESDDEDSGNESSDIEELGLEVSSSSRGLRSSDVPGCDLMDTSSNPASTCTTIDEYPARVLSTEEVVQHMVECINEVNTIVELPPTVTRILLNHFKWDKEKLYER